jgi:hypothetical protein
MDEIKKRRTVLFNEFRTQHQLNHSVLCIIYRLLSLSCGLNHDTYTDCLTDAIMDTIGLSELTIHQRNHVRNMCHIFRHEFKDRVHVMVSWPNITYELKPLHITTMD